MKKYESKESRINLAKELEKESIILLKNQNTILPLDLDKEVAVFGRFQLETLIGGSGGEECDRRVEEDYYLTQSEKQMIELVGKHFNDVILILNINGYIDLSWVSDYPSIKGIIYMGTAGEQGASALAEVLVGEINPSGKLAGTIACSYDDYPSSEYFVTNKDRPDEIPTYEDYGLSAQENKSYGFDKSPVALYQEGIYVGYRYFDTFNKEVLYPFGFGMSYTNFEIQYDDSYIKEQNLILSINVVNKGSQYSGKEVVQVYVSAPEGRIEKPYQELITEVCKNRLTLLEENKDKLEFLSQGESDNQLRNKLSSDKVLCTLEAFAINTKEDHPVKEVDQSIENQNKWTLLDVKNGKLSMDKFVEQLSIEELAVLVNGYGPGLPFGGIGSGWPSTIAYDNGEDIATSTHPAGHPVCVSPGLTQYGTPSVFYKDGPAGVSMVAWPTGMSMACTFNKGLMYEFGHACGTEAEMIHVDSWLAPAVNIQSILQLMNRRPIEEVILRLHLMPQILL